MTPFDILVLTAANEAQAAGYKAQLERRRGSHAPHTRVRSMVITDPGGRRVGSLGATLHVLARLFEEESGSGKKCSARQFFTGKRILICHSGGDSRRTPAYAAQGKVFTPVPTCSATGEPLSLFDLILQTAMALPAPPEGHVLITSGDVLLTFDHASVDFSQEGVTGVAYYGPAARGSRHGVYVPQGFGSNPQRTECLPVADFLQKPTEQDARASGAVDHLGHVAVDTGLISLSPQVSARLLESAGALPANAGTGGVRKAAKGLLAEIIDGSCPALDIYEELAMALAPRRSEERYLEHFVTARGHGAAHMRRMRALYRSLRDIPFQVNIVPYCDFFHIGSSRELLSGFSGLSRTAQTYGFCNYTCAAIARGDNDSGQAFVFNSRIEAPLTSGRALIEAVHLGAKARLELSGDNIVTGLPPGIDMPIALPAGLGVVCLPIGTRQWAAVVYGLDDDFKTPFSGGAGGAEAPCLFLNRPIEEGLARLGLSPGRVWLDDQQDGLWSARLWRVGTLHTAIAEAMVVAGRRGAAGATAPVADFSTRARRFSLAQLLPRVNHARLLALRAEIKRQVNLTRVAARLLASEILPAKTICEEIHTAAEAELVLASLATLLREAAGRKPLLRARILRLVDMVRQITYGAGQSRGLSRATIRHGLPRDPQMAAFAAVAESVAVSHEPYSRPRAAAILHDQVVWATTPVRIDFAGGWSDTPPICTERGGTVLNAAVTLNGHYPVQVMAKLNTHGCIRLASIDLGERREIRTTAELLDHHDPHDWTALAKAAMILAGVGPSEAGGSLKQWLRGMGGGLDLTIFSSLPKGSGMGTSSILGAAVIACLDRVLGVPFNTDRLIRMTSILEQRMCTGGGWQDQVGGILPGVKLIRTQPGPDQTVSLRWATFDLALGRELRERCLLYFTGQKRMARNILQNVVNRYLARDPDTLQTVEALKVSAEATKEALDAQDIEGFARGVSHYWELKKRIDPGSTNAPIEALLQSVEKHLLAALLPGAGGGGFIFMIAKNAAAAAHVRRHFTQCPPNPQARFFDFAIDRQGLKVTVL